MKPFAVISDLHLHSWSAFSTTTDEGNSRLHILLAEIDRAVMGLHSVNGDKLIVAGDVFHVRGNVSPSVLNPTLAKFHQITDSGIQVYVIAGNHDLEGNKATWLSSAVSALESVDCVCVSDSPLDLPDGLTLFPWREDLSELKGELQARANPDRIAIIHAPINSVIKSLPNIGLDPQWLEDLGYKAIFSGHYHHHKQAAKNVWSIGAIAHHSWSDVGTKAGYLLVTNGNEVTWRASHAPEFVELVPGMAEEEMKLLSDGNYVKVRVNSSDIGELDEIRKTLLAAGARGVIVIPDPEVKGATREASAISKGMTLPESVAQFINAGTYANKPDLTAYCAKILASVDMS